MNRLVLTLAALGITCALVISQPAHAQITEVISRPAGDTINWGQLNLAPGTTFQTPQPFISYGGIAGTATVDQQGTAVIQEQCCVGLNGLWDGNFSPGDLLFDNTGVLLTLSFKKP